MTPYGYTTLAFALLVFYISYRIIKRMNNDKKVGCVGFAYVSIFYLILCAVSIPFVITTSTSLYRIITYDTYKAEIVEVNTYMNEDSDGNDTLMYTPTVKFTPKGSAEPITRKLEIGSGAPYHIGDSHKVAYDSDTGKIESKSITSILLLSVAFIFSLMLSSIVIYGVYYAFFEKLAFDIMDMIKIYFIYILLPIGMLGINASLIYYLYEYFITGARSDAPVWATILAIFFVLVLSLSTIPIFKMLREIK